MLREARCRACGSRRTWPPLSRHHLVPRSAGGDDVESNLVPTCEDCHGLLHRGDSRKVRSALRARLRPDELAYVRSKKGTAWLDDRYPVAERGGTTRDSQGGRGTSSPGSPLA